MKMKLKVNQHEMKLKSNSIDLFTDSDTILITSLFAMHCGLSVVYEIQNKE